MSIEIPEAAITAAATYLEAFWGLLIADKTTSNKPLNARFVAQFALEAAYPSITADLRARTEKPLADVIHHSEWLIRNEQKYGNDMDNAITRLLQQALSSLVAALAGTERGDDGNA